MKKTLLAMAVGATIVAAPVIAQADVKLYGKIQVEVVNLDGGIYDNYTRQGDYSGMSRIGFDASKDLGNGLKAIGKLAWGLNPSDGSNNGFAFSREQYVGLAGGWGAFIAGRVQSPYKTYGGVKWDPFVATFMQARRMGGMSGDATGHNGFVNDQLVYASPVMAGIKFAAHYGLDQDAVSPTNGGADGTWGAGVSGTWGPVEVIGAYLTYKNTTNNLPGVGCEGPACGGDKISNSKIGVRYKGQGLTAALQYEDVDNVGGIRVNGLPVGRVGKGKVLFANLGYKFGNTLIAGNYGTTDAKSDLQKDIDYWALGARYYLAKKVSTYIGYAETKQDTKYKLLGVGMRYDF
jgi:predicted porin